MHYTKDYSKSPAPNFDAVEDIKDYLGAKYDTIAAQIKDIANSEQFALWCDFMGIKGLPVRAWYDHFHGEGAWAKDQAAQNPHHAQDTTKSEK